MRPYLESYKLAGIIAIVADKSGRIHYRNLLGYTDVEAKKPMSEDNVFWVASMSKMFVGASVMMLVDEGKVSLDDPLRSSSRNSTNGWWSWRRTRDMSFSSLRCAP